MARTPTYLIGFAEAVATPEVCFSLRSKSRIICFYRKKGGGRFARLDFVEYFPITAPETNFEQALHELQILVDGLQPELTAPCDDAALFLLSRLKAANARSLLPGIAACEFALDKLAQTKVALQCGFSVPRTELLNGGASIANFDRCPAILKPRAAIDLLDGHLEKGRSFLLANGALSSKAREALAQRPYLMQEYKLGVGEGFFGIACDGDIYAGFGHRRLRMMNPQGSGASACVSRIPDPDEFDAASKLVERINWQGPFMVESLRDNSGRRWFMEFNGRFWGSLALARRCGLDMPRLAFDLRSGRPISPPLKASPGFARHLGRDLINLLLVLRGPGNGACSDHWPTRFSAVREFFVPHSLRSFYNYDPSRPLFFLKDAIFTVSNMILGTRA